MLVEKTDYKLSKGLYLIIIMRDSGGNHKGNSGNNGDSNNCSSIVVNFLSERATLHTFLDFILRLGL